MKTWTRGSLAVFQGRRRRLGRQLGDAVAIIPTAPERTRNADNLHPYRWDSGFHYLCGFPEPEAVLVVVGGKRPRSILFCRPRDPERERWEGRCQGPEGAVGDWGIDEAYPIEALDQQILELLEGRSSIYSYLGWEEVWDRRVTAWIDALRRQARAGQSAPHQWVEARHLIDEMRLFKDDSEIQLMARAASISALAHRRAMQATAPGRHEYEIEAELLHEFRLHGAEAPAYPSIVAGGANACVLHYVANADRLRGGDLLLIDAGCEWRGYAGDITRTFPVDGRFTPPQRDIYQLVLAAQTAALKKVAPGRPFVAAHEAAVAVLAQGLVDLKLCKGSVEAVIESGDYRRYYMHRTGHWLGRDVHDVGAYRVKGRSRRLEAGMVLTVEPGLYIGTDGSVPRALRGIGVRIEDDVVVTDKGHHVLTSEAPKTIDEIETWMGCHD